MSLKDKDKLKVAIFETSNVLKTLWSKFMSGSDYEICFLDGKAVDQREIVDCAPDFLVFPGVPDDYSPADIISGLNALIPDLHPTVIVSTSLDQKDMENEWDIEIVNGVLLKPFTKKDIFQTFDPFVAEKLRSNSEKPRVVLIDDSSTVVTVLRKQIESLGFHVDTANDGREGVDLVLETMPHVVVVDLQMPRMSGYEVCSELAANPRTRRIPVIIESASISQDTARKGFLAGAIDLLPKPVDSDLLAKALSQAVPRKSTGHRGNLLVPEDSPIISSIITKLASEMEMTSVVYSTIKEFKAHLTVSKPDIISIDLSLPDGSGLDVVRDIRSDSRFDSIPLLVLTGDDEYLTMIQCLESGANDYITKPFTKQEFMARLNGQLRVKELFNQVVSKNRILQELAYFDALTGLMNRRFFDKQIKQILNEAEKQKRSVGLMMLDLDHFKKVNDTYGHETGDEVLAEIAEIVQRNVRQQDFTCRYGGEEMAILLPDCNLTRTHEIAQRICKACAANTVSKHLIEQTVSIGISAYPNPSKKSSIISDADNALYSAKETGRNRVVVAS